MLVGTTDIHLDGFSGFNVLGVMMKFNDYRDVAGQRTGGPGPNTVSGHGQWSARMTFTPSPDVHRIPRLEGLRSFSLVGLTKPSP